MNSYVLLTSILLSLSSSAVDFNSEIKPILSRKCFSCHSKDKQKGKLRLDVRGDALKSLVENNGKQPEILNRIFHIDPDEIMPPPEKGILTDHEKNLVKQWVSEGAKYDTHWAFTAPQKVTPPDIQDKWVSNDIDKFILKKLNDINLKPNPVKFDHKLFRRISFILTGLPPDEADYEKFSKGQLKYEDYVARLLKSDHFGENMAVWWLDGARYGDTNGIEYDNSRPIWPYRDWVIKAFNDNKPYDEFLIEQIAGDLIPNATLSQKVATGFLRCNISTNEQGSIEEEFSAYYAKDRLNTTIMSTTGLTVGCAECHDHKYDPISQKEYYQLLAFFNNIDGIAVGQPSYRSDEPLVPIVKNEKFENINNWEKDISVLQKKISSLKEKTNDDFWWWHYQQQANPLKTIFLVGKLDNYFPLDEKEGTFTYNLITEQPCNIKGIFSRLNGKYGQSQGFRGSSFIDCLNVAKYDSNSSFTLGCWIQPEKGNKGAILAKFNTQLSKGWKITIEDGHLNFYISGSLGKLIEVKTTQKLINEKWSHIAVSYDGSGKASGVKFYVNAKEVKSQILNDTLEGPILIGNNMRIASESINNALDFCKVDEVFTAGFIFSETQLMALSRFDADYRFALIHPNKILDEQKSILKKYYLQYEHPETSIIHREIFTLKSRINDTIKSSVTSMVMKEKTVPVETYILDRGNYSSPLAKVNRKTPAFLHSFDESFPLNRLGLAQWLVDEKNPLTARFIVNRIWQEIFGYGLVSTVTDFGTQGDFPSHPKLLDYLALELMRNNWNLKQLISKIVNSSTFKQTSNLSEIMVKGDLKNIFYSRFPRRRLKAEQLRDQALKISQKLNSKVYGKPVFPYQPSDLWKEVTADVSDTRVYHQSKGIDNYRRSIYTFWKRNFPPPSMFLFDAPTRQTCSLQRKVSNTPNQALVLLNDLQFTELYSETSKLIFEKNSKLEIKITQLFYKVLLREPSPSELTFCKEFLSNSQDFSKLVKVIMNLDETLNIE